MNKETAMNATGSTPQPAHRPEALIYVKPELYRHGDIRSLTLGSPIGMGESGGMSITQQAV